MAKKVKRHMGFSSAAGDAGEMFKLGFVGEMRGRAKGNF